MSTAATGIAEHTAFTFPLNVYAHAIRLETGALDSLHFGLYQRPGESLFDAQRNATALLLSQLPEPPGRVLEVGVGLGVTLRELLARGYAVVGISPDPSQLARLAGLEGPQATLVQSRFEDMQPEKPGYEVVLFQESAQYIRPHSLLITLSRRLLRPGGTLLIMDELPADMIEPLLALAAAEGLLQGDVVDLTEKALPSVAELAGLIERHQAQLVQDLDPVVMAAGFAAALAELTAGGDAALQGLGAAEADCLQRILRFLQDRGLGLAEQAAAQPTVDDLRAAQHFVEHNRPLLQQDPALSALMVAELVGTLRKRCRDYGCGAWRYCLLELRKPA